MFRLTGRMLVIFICFGLVIVTLSYTLIHNLSLINDLNHTLISLEEDKSELENKENILESDIKRMSDPLYISKYIREKYFYSKDGEIVLKIDD